MENVFESAQGVGCGKVLGMKPRPVIAALSAVLLGAALLSGCGNSGAATPGRDTPGQPSAPATTAGAAPEAGSAGDMLACRKFSLSVPAITEQLDVVASSPADVGITRVFLVTEAQGLQDDTLSATKPELQQAFDRVVQAVEAIARTPGGSGREAYDAVVIDALDRCSSLAG